MSEAEGLRATIRAREAEIRRLESALVEKEAELAKQQETYWQLHVIASERLQNLAAKRDEAHARVTALETALKRLALAVQRIGYTQPSVHAKDQHEADGWAELYEANNEAVATLASPKVAAVEVHPPAPIADEKDADCG